MLSVKRGNKMDSSIKIVTVVQARTGSTRLPGKVMLPLAEKPLLVRLIERIKAAKLVKTLVVATTYEQADDPIEKLCQEEKIECFRGHPTDLLDRHYQVGLSYGADAVVKIPSDVPLIDPKVIDSVLGFYVEHHKNYDYVSNLHPASYPDGNDVEVINQKSLYKAWLLARKPFEREHTTPFIWEKTSQFRLANVAWETGLSFALSHRWTIDYPADYLFIKTVYDELYSQNNIFSMEEILALVEQKPEIAEINSAYAGVNWYRNHLKDLSTIKASDTEMEPLVGTEATNS